MSPIPGWLLAVANMACEREGLELLATSPTDRGVRMSIGRGESPQSTTGTGPYSLMFATELVECSEDDPGAAAISIAAAACRARYKLYRNVDAWSVDPKPMGVVS